LILSTQHYPSQYDRNFGQKTITVKGGSEIHHLIADNVWRSEPLLQHLLAKGWANMDEKPNLIELAKTQSALDDVRKANPGAKLSDVIHSGEHEKYDDLAIRILEAVIKDMEKASSKSNWKNFSKVELLQVLEETLQRLRDMFMNEPDKLPKNNRGTLGFIPTQGRDTA
jgi:A nuclease family of the HNH/ENDO VII superfamily with conserved AHH